jgi:hypothetical protein
MLNAILKKLNGHGQDVESLEAALTQLLEERGTAERELKELRIRRHQGLLDDAADRILNDLERQIARAEIAMEKIDAAMPGLRQRIANARDAELRAAESGIISEFAECLGEYCKALNELARANSKQRDIRERASATLGAARAAILLPMFQFRGIATPESVKQWTEENLAAVTTSAGSPPPKRREATPGTSALPPRAKVPQRLPHEMRPTTPAAHVAATLDTGRDAPRGTRRPLLKDSDPLEAGEVRCLIVRTGYQLPNGTTTAAGDMVRLTLPVAENALRSGAVEIIERQLPPAALSPAEAIP